MPCCCSPPRRCAPRSRHDRERLGQRGAADGARRRRRGRGDGAPLRPAARAARAGAVRHRATTAATASSPPAHLRERGAEVHVGTARRPGAGAAATRAWRWPDSSPPDSRCARWRTRRRSGRLVATRDQWDFAVDALLGTGARGDPEGVIAAGVQALRELDDVGTQVVAVDLPTGVHADTGEIARRAVRADLTVTFGAPKRGHFLYPGRAFAGALEVVDIGLAPVRAGAVPDRARAPPPSMAALLPARDPRAHKGSVGRVLVVGRLGRADRRGGARRARRAALGRGLRAGGRAALRCTTCSRSSSPRRWRCRCPRPPERTLAIAALEPLLAQAARAGVLAIGSGLSRHAESAELARRIVADRNGRWCSTPTGSTRSRAAPTLLARGRAARVLTPHLGEMARLTGVDAAALEASRIDAAREWAGRWRAVVVLKGAPTVTAAPDGRATVNPTGNPGLATAGTGDVLTGVIAGAARAGALRLRRRAARRVRPRHGRRPRRRRQGPARPDRRRRDRVAARRAAGAGPSARAVAREPRAGPVARGTRAGVTASTPEYATARASKRRGPFDGGCDLQVRLDLGDDLPLGRRADAHDPLHDLAVLEQRRRSGCSARCSGRPPGCSRRRPA